MRRIISLRNRLFAGALLLLLAACTPGVFLKWSAVDAGSLAASEPGRQKLNTIRVATFGPYAEQIYGYFLYRDGIAVVTGDGDAIARLGKLTYGEARDDYARVVKANMYNPRALITREILRGGDVVGYTLADIKMDVDIWDVTPAGQGSGIVLHLDYKDRRYIDRGGSDSGEMTAGH
jgi:hypothetical protein